MQLKFAVKGGQRVAENLVLEVRAIAQRLGLETSAVEMERPPKARPKKTRKK